jgi:Flp pilus assembly protein TadG
MRRCFKIRRRSTRLGAEAVEFAFVAPVFFLFVFGLIELGRAVMIQQCLTNAARVGCRHAVLATTQTDDQVKSILQDHLRSAINDPSVVTCDVSPENLFGIAPGSEVTVSVSVNFADLSWLPLGFLNPVISSEAIQQRE